MNSETLARLMSYAKVYAARLRGRRQRQERTQIIHVGYTLLERGWFL